VDLDQWKVRAGGLQEVQRLKGTVATILKDFETVARFSVLLAYGLSLVISQRGDALTAHRIALIESLLRNEAFLDGLIHVSESSLNFLLRLTFPITSCPGSMVAFSRSSYPLPIPPSSG
jgi:hypothetical protein